MSGYLLFKSLHLIAVISWMAGLLYLPRIFVYHAETLNNEDKDKTFKTMERRLFLYIMNPSMILSWFFGLLLLHSISLLSFIFHHSFLMYLSYFPSAASKLFNKIEPLMFVTCS